MGTTTIEKVQLAGYSPENACSNTAETLFEAVMVHGIASLSLVRIFVLNLPEKLRQIACLLAAEKLNKNIATALGMGLRTVESHRAELRKLIDDAAATQENISAAEFRMLVNLYLAVFKDEPLGDNKRLPALELQLQQFGDSLGQYQPHFVALFAKQLTLRMKSIMKCYLEGQLHFTIARKMNIGKRTIESFVMRFRTKRDTQIQHSRLDPAVFNHLVSLGLLMQERVPA